MADAKVHQLDPRKMGGNSSVLVPMEVGGLYTQDNRFTHTEHMWLMQRPVFERLADGGRGALMPLFEHVHRCVA